MLFLLLPWLRLLLLRLLGVLFLLLPRLWLRTLSGLFSVLFLLPWLRLLRTFRGLLSVLFLLLPWLLRVLRGWL
jgi:hypothetical protein